MTGLRLPRAGKGWWEWRLSALLLPAGAVYSVLQRAAFTWQQKRRAHR